MTAGRAVAVFGSSRAEPGTAEWRDAEAVGARLASAGFGVVTGGYGGVMEAASLGASRAGGEVIGVTAPRLFPDRAGANGHVTREIPAEGLAERIGVLMSSAIGAIVLPGSIGTAAELVIAWNINHIMRGNGGPGFPTVAVGDVWRRLWELLVVQADAHGDDIRCVDDADDAVAWLLSRPELIGAS